MVSTIVTVVFWLVKRFAGFKPLSVTLMPTTQEVPPWDSVGVKEYTPAVIVPAQVSEAVLLTVKV